MPDNNDIDTEMYLRDGFPHATVCKVQLKDGRIGIGLFRQGAVGSTDQQAADAAALADALENVPEPNLEADIAAGRAFTVTDEPPDDDLQAKLGQPAR